MFTAEKPLFSGVLSKILATALIKLSPYLNRMAGMVENGCGMAESGFLLPLNCLGSGTGGEGSVVLLFI